MEVLVCMPLRVYVWVLNIEYSSEMQSGERKHQIYYAFLNNLAYVP